MIHPFLVGQNVYLRGLEETDLTGNYFQWFNDQEVCRFNSHGRFPNSLQAMRDYLHLVHTSSSDLALAIIVKKNDVHIGNIALQGIDWISRSAEYAIIVGEKKYWGKGCATEASDLLLAHAFGSLNLQRVHCGTSSDNTAMQRLAEYMGMKREGVRRNGIYKEGKYRDIYEYGILREEYLERQRKRGADDE
jgi:RimJ/RimL family protein N-acetyltransferase